MPTVLPVRFKYASRDLWFEVGTTAATEADHVICETERGLEIGLATEPARELTDEELRARIGDATLKPVIRIATDADFERAEELATKGEEALPVFREAINALELDMKPVGVEWLFEGDKIICYFAAEERVDFRQLVRDLASKLHERIDMRQIGVREEATVVGGYGHCGQELCCTRFGLSFEPVSIRMAKEQDLPLNSTKISGACGRLMCCLRYEFEAYRDFHSRAPKRNAVIDTPLGKAKIVEYNTPKEELTLRVESGKTIRVSLADMTASEAACKKSEEQGCVCRPDTVSRAVLERLTSPDVQMALAELDRQNGLIEEESFDSADIFVKTKTSGSSSKEKSQKTEQRNTDRKRRRRSQSSAPQSSTQQSTSQSEQTAGAPKQTRTRSRRRHHEADAQAQAAAQEKSQATPRRRRPGDHGGEKSSAEPTSDARKSTTRTRRRRHHKGSVSED